MYRIVRSWRPDVTEQAATTPANDHLDIADVERRIKAIFIGSIGNLVEWYDFYAYTAFALYFAPAFFPQQRSGRPAAERRRAVRRDLPDAAARRLAVRLHRRPVRPADVADAVGALHVLRLADHRGDADLCLDRRRRAGHAGAGPHHRGPEPRRRIRRQRHLSQRGRRPAGIAASIRASSTSR